MLSARGLGLIILAALSAPKTPAHALPSSSLRRPQARWADESVVWDHLAHGVDILGQYKPCHHLCDWMSRISDDTPLADVNIPGTHDTATWNYTQETQNLFLNFTGTNISPANIYQCQDQSIIESLNSGIRAFDLRIGLSPADNTSIIFYHSAAIMSLQATLEDVLYGFYKFLDDHPSETVILSVKGDNSTFGTAQTMQTELYNLIFSEPAVSYFNQLNASISTLGQARGKLNLVRRYNTNDLPTNDTRAIGFGVSGAWLDNVANFSIEYAPSKFIYVEDYYNLGGPPGAQSKIQWKYNATTSHLEFAAKEHLDSLFFTFASAEQGSDVPPETPKIIALGNGSVAGMNQRLLPFLKARKHQRHGIIMLDWFKQVPGLIEAILGAPF